MKILSFFLNISIFKSLKCSFAVFPRRLAWKLPIIVYRNTSVRQLNSVVVKNTEIKFGLIQFGRNRLGITDVSCKTIIDIKGELIIMGEKISIGQGSKVIVEKGAQLVLGSKFCVSGNSTIICKKSITFGDDCLLSWDILIMDTDYHKIVKRGQIINYDQPIEIGRHVWICCKSVLLKGSVIPDNCIVAAGSIIINKKYSDSKCIITSNKLLKNDVDWAE